MTDIQISIDASSTRRESRLAPAHLIGGVGGLVFAASVVAQNGIRASFPGADASAQKVIDFYGAHRGATLVLAALYPVGAIGLAAFAGGLLSRLRSRAARGPAFAGAIGLAGVFAIFTATVASDLAVAGYVHRGSAAADTVTGLWVLHNAIFGVLTASIGVALAGLTAASVAEGLIGAAWKPAGLLGGIALCVSAAFTPAILDGSGMIAIGLAGFVVWLAFVVVVSVALLRTPGADADN